jgi:predicted kinase
MTLGHSGSGKSFFVRELVKKVPAVRLNGDTLRIEMYGSTEELDRYRVLDPTLSKEKIFKAVDYMAKQVLSAGFSVIYESNNNKRSIRQNLEALANAYGAVPAVVWIQTSPEVAMQRIQEREETPDSRRWDEQAAREVVERHIANTDEPGDDENVIKINGTVSFEEQFESFEKQLTEIVS